jgi:hypothetical protein
MGYRSVEIAHTIFIEMALLAALGLLVAAFAWMGLTLVLRAPMAAAWFPVPLDLSAHDFGLCSAPACALLVVATLVGIRTLLGADLGASLRHRTMG